MKATLFLRRLCMALLCLISFHSFKAQCTFTSTAPYLENFSSVSTVNQLPTCWVATNLGTACGTLPAPFNCAAISSSLMGTHYFYTHGFQLYTGITYSVSMWYKLNLAVSNYSNFAIALSSNQSSVTLTPLASTSGPISNTSAALLSGTFTVPSSTIYYFALSAMVTGTAPSQQGLFLDDFSLTMPCILPNNSPQLIATPASTNVCNGAVFTCSVGGANSYTWSNGSNSAVQSITVVTANVLSVIGTKSLTGCTASTSVMIGILPNPVVSAFSNPASTCLGGTVTLTANGASSYQWNTGASGPVITVTVTNPNGIYGVIGTAANSCTGSAQVQVQVNPLPQVAILASNDTVCIGANLVLQASGAQTYTWTGVSGASNATTLQANTSTSQTYTLNGTDGNGCSNSATLALVVDACTGVKEKQESLVFMNLFPNPAKTRCSVQIHGEGQLAVFDRLGRCILKNSVTSGMQELLIEDWPQGLYHFRFVSVSGAAATAILARE